MTPPLRFRLTTLGCRVNHAETRDLESILRVRGLTRSDADQPADLEVIHTCSVTHTAAAKSRHAIRRAARRLAETASGVNGAFGGQSMDASRHAVAPGLVPPPPQVIVTGCLAGTDPHEASGLIGDPTGVIPHASDDDSTLAERFARRVDRWLANQPVHPTVRRSAPGSSSGTVIPLPVVIPRPGSGRHVRAEVRIQEGCDAHCSFCILPSIRPTLRSKTVADVVSETRRLVDLGHREVVLSGIFIGAYGHETALRRRQRHPDAEPLADLIDHVACIPGLERLRISSMEPGDVSEPLLDAMLANSPVVVPHLHLPLQSGSDRVLRRMNRQYRVGAYLDMIDRVVETLTTTDGLPPALTTDVICGFPGEDDDDFRQTVGVARRVGFLHMHVFPFSPRRGTAAARWTDRFIDAATVRHRVRRLIDLETDAEDGLAIRYRRRLAGRTVRVIVERPDQRHEGWITGRCDHYERISVRTDAPRGALIEVRIVEVTPDRTVGERVRPTIALPLV